MSVSPKIDRKAHGFEIKACVDGWRIDFCTIDGKWEPAKKNTPDIMPGFYPHMKYIVADAYRKFRIAEKDGNQIQLFQTQDEFWQDVKMQDVPLSNFAQFQLRVKPNFEVPASYKIDFSILSHKKQDWPRWYYMRSNEHECLIANAVKIGQSLVTDRGYLRYDFHDNTVHQNVGGIPICGVNTVKELRHANEAEIKEVIHFFNQYKKPEKGDIGIFWGEQAGIPFIGKLESIIEFENIAEYRYHAGQTRKSYNHFYKLPTNITSFTGEIRRFEIATGQSFWS